jgi:hypothetical protein
MIKLLVDFRGKKAGDLCDFGCLVNLNLVRKNKAVWIKIADIKMKVK